MASREARAEKQLICQVAVFEGGVPLWFSFFLLLPVPQSCSQHKLVALKTLVWCSHSAERLFGAPGSTLRDAETCRNESFCTTSKES